MQLIVDVNYIENVVIICLLVNVFLSCENFKICLRDSLPRHCKYPVRQSVNGRMILLVRIP